MAAIAPRHSKQVVLVRRQSEANPDLNQAIQDSLKKGQSESGRHATSRPSCDGVAPQQLPHHLHGWPTVVDVQKDLGVTH